ncbi:histidine kinase [Streptomyces sedi]|uniref:histidine kinase n=1 Tax=Streptomyces sedi TaxID=555059 RepID=UPI001476E3B7|nr:histidine kinase [Streptomyces sedi]
MEPRTVLEALARNPLGYLRSAWPWRAALYLLSGCLCTVAVGLGAAGLVLTAPGGVAGACCALLLVTGAVGVSGVFERRRLVLVDRDRHGVPRRRRAIGYGAVSVLAVGWVDLGVLLLALGIPCGLLLSPLQPTAATWQSVTGPIAGVLLLPVVAYPVGAWAGARGTVAREVLDPGDRRLREVTRSRARLVDAFDAERRRIERDLHDGAQQRLVALHMRLGLAGLDLPPGSTAAKDVREAHTLAGEALAELREFLRGVHPQILTERGLPAALRDVAGRCAVPADLDLGVPGRLPTRVEETAYFVATEALTNVARHSGAGRCRVTARLHDEVLRLEIEDDGAGGADPARGTGLTGLADRIAAADGRMFLSSPPGGPTLLRADIPCSSPPAS